MSVTIKIDSRALDKALHDLGNHMQARRIGRKTLTQAGKPMLDLAVALAPDDPNTSGALKQSIKMQPARKAALGRGGAGLLAELDRDEVVGVVIGIDAEVLPTVMKPRQRGKQTGRERRGKRGGLVEDLGVAGYSVIQEFGSVRMAANPFMRPAFDAEAEGTIRRSVTILEQEIAKAVARKG